MPYNCNEQPPFAGRRPSRCMHFPSFHSPSLGSFRVLGLHSFDLVRKSGPWANLFPWEWLRPFSMRERKECFPLVVRASSGRPTRRRAAPPPTFLWFGPIFSLMLTVRSCSLPLSTHCFGNIVVWSINFGFWILNKNFERQCCQTAGRCRLWLLKGFQTDKWCSSKWISWRLCFLC